MEMLSSTEEDYLKTIYNLQQESQNVVSTNEISNSLNIKASTVTDMLKRLSSKKLIKYKPYYGTSLTKKGNDLALALVRKHRLWETFLVEHLGFEWSEVHDIAEQMEHVNSDKLINNLDKFMGFPKVDPHGDPIPSEKGEIEYSDFKSLCETPVGNSVSFCGVGDSSSEFLEYLTSINLTLGKKITIFEVIDYDESIRINTENEIITLSKKVGKNILVK